MAVKRFRLVENWRAVLKHAWSIRFLGGVIVLTGLDACLPMLIDYFPIPRWEAAIVICVVAGAAIGARLTYQPKVQLRQPEKTDSG